MQHSRVSATLLKCDCLQRAKCLLEYIRRRHKWDISQSQFMMLVERSRANCVGLCSMEYFCYVHMAQKYQAPIHNSHHRWMCQAAATEGSCLFIEYISELCAYRSCRTVATKKRKANKSKTPQKKHPKIELPPEDSETEPWSSE
jgi:hypothetical protein